MREPRPESFKLSGPVSLKETGYAPKNLIFENPGR